MRIWHGVVVSTGLMLALQPAAAQQPPPSPILKAMHDELARSLDYLERQPDPPYFISYEITETATANVTASFGALETSDQSRRRVLDIDVRVGDYALDNSHQVRGAFPDVDFDGLFFGFPIDIPLDDEPDAIRAILWYHTEQNYQRAVERLARVRTNVHVTVAQEDSSADFSRAPAEQYVEPVAQLALDRAAWEARLERYTAPFARHGDIYQATADLTAEVVTRWYVNSDGSAIQISRPQYRLLISATTRANDGMDLPRYESWFAVSPEELPADEQVLSAVQRMIADLEALRAAPVADPYTGPAILSGRASAVFFHEVFGHRIEGHRQKLEDEGQTFRNQVSEQILPATFSVYFDPTLKRAGNLDLAGHYPFDNQGVRARRVVTVDRGILTNFLMSRTPIEGFPSSNGHGRKEPGSAPVARQSNLIVEVSQPHTRAELLSLLLDQVRREGKPYGLYFADIQGGFTFTGRVLPNMFNVLPVMVYRVYPDGRQELVRGVDLIGTPLTVFSKVTAADDQIEVFNGMCWAESGAVPVSAVSPGVLLSQVEVQKQAKGSELPPLLSPPPESPAPRADDPLQSAMRDEMARSMEQLRLDTLPRPYFIAYRVREVTRATVSATFGSVLQDHETRVHQLEVEVRVGDYDFDNTNFLGFPDVQFMAGLVADRMVLPLDNDYREVRRRLWLATDAAYKQAVQQLAQKRAALRGRTRTDDVPDFSREPPVTIADTVRLPPANRAAGVALARHLSGLFRQMPEVTWSNVSWHAASVRTLYLNSEGTAFVRLDPEVSVQVEAATQATDGAPIEDFVAFRGRTSRDLPDRDVLAQAVRRLGERIGRVRQAALPTPYAGPVLFEGQAAAELFHQVFAPRLTATRVPVGDDPQFAFLTSQLGNPFVDAIGSRVLPSFLSVADDATAADHEGTALPVYRVDDDGVPTRRTSLVERGILKTLLAGRVPVRGVLRSTGNRFGEEAVVTNLLVSTAEGVSESELRKRLLDLATQRGLEYAVVVRRVANPAVGGLPAPSEIFSGFMSMLGPGGAGTQSLTATEAFKLYPDGREEPLRNSEIIGLTAATFKDIVAASRDRVVYATPGSPALAFHLPIPFPLPIPALAGLSRGLRSTYVVPSLLFEDVSLRGPRGELPRPMVAPHPFFPRRP